MRGQGTVREGLSWYFAQFNRNKRSVVLDLRAEAGRVALADLIATADVLVENFRPGVLDRMGFDRARLAELNPRLVVGSVNGYGSSGPYVDRPAFDFIAQAMSGFMAVNGEPSGPPMRAAPPISDLVAGLYCAFGIACALRARDDGAASGERVETSLMGGLISMLGFLSAEYLARGEPPARTGNDHGLVAPYGLFAARDGTIAVAPSNDVFVARFLDALGLGALLAEPAFASNEARVANRDRLKALIEARTRTETVDHWIAALNEAGCPCGRVMDLPEVFADPQVRAQEMVLDVDHPGHGTVAMTGFPVKLERAPCRVRRPAPDLGADTADILGRLGYGPARIAAASGAA